MGFVEGGVVNGRYVGGLEILREFDTMLIMSVEPGFGGQKFIPEVLVKVGTVRRLVDAGELTIVVEIDGEPCTATALYDPTSVVELRGPRFSPMEEQPDLQQ